MMEADQGEGCEYPLVIAGGAATFAVVNTISGHLAPQSACNTKQQKWKWRNVATSLIHSIITGTWALAVFYKAPFMREDLQRKFTKSSHTLVCFSIGYFIYDAIDMLVNHRKRSTYELLLHHCLVIICYLVAVVSKQFVAFVALSLVVEVNSVFLHARQLLIITNQPKNSSRYKANALLNVLTFLLFRIILLAYLTRWISSQRNKISFGFLAVAFVGLGVIDIMNIILFCRIVYIDMEIFKPVKLPDEISIEKPSSDIQHDNDETSDKQITNNLTPTNLCARDTTIEDNTINHDDINTNNQNFVNGCQKRAQWAAENLVTD